MSFVILYTGVILILPLFYVSATFMLLSASFLHLTYIISLLSGSHGDNEYIDFLTNHKWQKQWESCTSPNSWQSYLWWEGHGRLAHPDRGILIWGGTSHHHMSACEAEDGFINMESQTHYSTNWCCVVTSLPSLGCLVSGMRPSKEVLKSKQRLAGRETSAFTSHLVYSSCGKSEWRRSPVGLLTN